jgi:osmotically-inducible protein OsmY
MRSAAAVFLSLLTFISPAPAASPHPLSPASQRPSDAAIEQTIRAKLAKSKIGKDGFQVHVKDGVATWEGHTSVMQHKGAATRMAKSAGATLVQNHIRVDGSPAVGGPRKATVSAP